MNRRVRQQFLSALDVSKSTRELGQNVDDILGEYSIPGAGKIDKDAAGTPYLMLQAERRRVVIRRSTRKRVRPLSQEEATEVQRSGIKTPADNVSAWEAVPVTDQGKEGNPVSRREHIADLLVNWLFKLENDDLDEYEKETKMASQQEDFEWGTQDEYGWEEQAPTPAPTRRPSPRRRLQPPAMDPSPLSLPESVTPSQLSSSEEARKTLALILKGVEVGQFSEKIAQRIVAHALSTYLDFDKPKEWLDEERERTMKQKVQQDVLSELAAKISGNKSSDPALMAALLSGSPNPQRRSRGTHPRPMKTNRRPRKPTRSTPPLSAMLTPPESLFSSDEIEDENDFEAEDFEGDDRFEEGRYEEE